MAATYTGNGIAPTQTYISSTDVSSVTIDISGSPTSVAYIVGTIGPAALSPSLFQARYQTSAGTAIQVGYRVNTAFTTASYSSTATSSNTRLNYSNTTGGNSSTAIGGARNNFIMKINPTSNNANPYATPSIIYNATSPYASGSIYYTNMIEYRARVRSNQEIGQVVFSMYSGPISEHRIRVYHLFGGA